MKIAKWILSSGGASTAAGDFGLFVMRAGFGFYMAAAHGRGKIPPSEGFIGATAGMGFPAPELFAWLAGLSEFGGGVLLALGLFTRPGALAILGTMSVAAFMGHANDPFFAAPGQPSKELAMLFWLAAFCVLLVGPGRYSLDAAIFKKRK